ncbi:hypothetical protein GOP47_0003899 [Adiantum capillus-veneris]|uniref:Uncharacterized protein n=1 Tax=Adiantum capillus-veneris TaxID=13818 RepID=A0A9D4V6H5_ADICA|nr:hypothetical protein GOP47_0003899 [Adiantum capillus-veneris]
MHMIGCWTCQDCGLCASRLAKRATRSFLMWGDFCVIQKTPNFFHRHQSEQSNLPASSEEGGHRRQKGAKRG